MQVHLHLVALTHHAFLWGIDSHDQKYCKVVLSLVQKKVQFFIKWIKNGLHSWVLQMSLTTSWVKFELKILCPNPSPIVSSIWAKIHMYPRFFYWKKSLKNLLVVIFKLNSYYEELKSHEVGICCFKYQQELGDVDWPRLGMEITHFLTPKLWLGTFNQTRYALDFWSIFQM
jgi:hypothetical protein